jgi:hypothetical protein
MRRPRSSQARLNHTSRQNREVFGGVQLVALIDVTCPGALTEKQRANLIEGLRAFVRFAE